MDIDSTRSHLPTTINPVNLAAPVLSETAYASSSSSSNFRETETFENHNRTSATPPLATRLNHLDLVATHSDVGDPPVGNQPTSESFPASRKTGYIYDERMMLHAPLGWVNEDTPFTDRLIQVQRESEDYENFRKRHDHPEDPRRISRIYEQMRRNGLIEQMVQLPMVEMSKKQAMLVHNERIYDEAEDQSCMYIDSCLHKRATRWTVNPHVHPLHCYILYDILYSKPFCHHVPPTITLFSLVNRQTSSQPPSIRTSFPLYKHRNLSLRKPFMRRSHNILSSRFIR